MIHIRSCNSFDIPTLLQRSVSTESQFLTVEAFKVILQILLQQSSMSRRSTSLMAAGRKKRVRCELCSKESALRCEADCANLCWECDANVHSANFLVARHFRVVFCCRCHGQTRTTICGACPQTKFSLCRACSGSVDSRQNEDMKVLSDLKRWYRALNLRNPKTVSLAVYFVERGRPKQGNMFRQKIRVYLAAALWYAATVCENEGDLPWLKKVEECTGIPLELIASAQSNMCSSMDLKMAEEGHEDSAECSSS